MNHRILFSLAQRVLARHPNLRPALVNLLRRAPSIDMYLRNALNRSEHTLSPLRMTSEHLPEAARGVYERLCTMMRDKSSR